MKFYPAGLLGFAAFVAVLLLAVNARAGPTRGRIDTLWYRLSPKVLGRRGRTTPLHGRPRGL